MNQPSKMQEVVQARDQLKEVEAPGLILSALRAVSTCVFVLFVLSPECFGYHD